MHSKDRSRTYSKKSANAHKFSVPIFLLIAVFVIIWKIVLPQYDLKRYPIKFSEIVSSAAKEFDLPEQLIYAVIFTESSFNENAISRANAKGLMQLTDDSNEWTAMLLGEITKPDDVFEPKVNIRRGCCLLAYLIKEFGNVETALAAYNAGIGRVRGWLSDENLSSDGKYLDKIPISETRAYVEKVLKIQNKYFELYYSN